MAKKHTYRRRPNNSGTVVKLSGNRRCPYMAKITTGYDILTGMQKQEAIGYFETRQEALDALSIYSLSNSKTLPQETLKTLGSNMYHAVMDYKDRQLPTFADIFHKVFEKDMAHLSPQRQAAYKAAFNRLSALHNRKINTISLFDLQARFDVSKKDVKQKTLYDMKALCSKVFEYAVIHQYIPRDNDYTSYINTKQKDMNTKSDKHKSFSMDEIKALKRDSSIEAKVVLTYILTGCRPIELFGISKKQIHIDELSNDNGKETLISYIVTGSKTESGKNRCIPIHNEIKPYICDVLKRLKNNKDVASYRYNIFDPAMKRIGLNHLPYDTRHTFATLAKLYKVDSFARKRIMGHKSADLTDDVYTHTLKNELYTEIQKIKI